MVLAIYVYAILEEQQLKRNQIKNWTKEGREEEESNQYENFV